MSIPVGLDRLREEMGRFGNQPYLLTTGDDARPHAVGTNVSWDGDRLVADAGRRSTANATARPSAALLWPPQETDGYSLIVDVTAASADADAGTITLEPAKAVLHRRAPAPEGSESTCGSDCVPLVEP